MTEIEISQQGETLTGTVKYNDIDIPVEHYFKWYARPTDRNVAIIEDAVANYYTGAALALKYSLSEAIISRILSAYFEKPAKDMLIMSKL